MTITRVDHNGVGDLDFGVSLKRSIDEVNRWESQGISIRITINLWNFNFNLLFHRLPKLPFMVKRTGVSFVLSIIEREGKLFGLV